MLFLPPECESTIRSEGQKAYPNECCGVMLGLIEDSGAKKVKKTQAIGNAQTDSEQYHRFLITPEDMLNAEQTARKMGLDVVGFYHSHPDCPAAPSDYDRDHALPFYSYVIVSVEKSEAKDLTSWELAADRTAFLPEKFSKEEQ
ncbi:MAG: M67 family metallopeptidase [Candidatus Fibromonas sp.]|jgi:proteasome lid subunit RPN8/RPN11|nr:M67 family metallopeptidase [Candidatus Fibromonas sp.]